MDPFITAAAACWGLIPGLAKYFYAGRSRKAKTVGIVLTIVATAAISSLVLTTSGLVLFQGYNFFTIIPGRLVQFALLVPIYCVLTCFLYFSPLTFLVMDTVKPAVLKKKTV